jgi:hypothetical protein
MGFAELHGKELSSGLVLRVEIAHEWAGTVSEAVFPHWLLLVERRR